MNETSGPGQGTTTLVVHVENKAGVLARVAGLFARRGYNIESLAVAPTNDDRFSRLTIVVGVDDAPMEQVVKQLDKLINVVDIRELNPSASVEREMLMAIVQAESSIRGQILDLVRIFQATVLNVGLNEIMVSLTGSPGRVDDFEDLLRPYGIVEAQRTGKVALPKLTKNATDQVTI